MINTTLWIYKSLTLLFLISSIWFGLSCIIVFAQSDEIGEGGVIDIQSTSNTFETSSLSSMQLEELGSDLNDFTAVTLNGDYTSAGVGLRGRNTGVIDLEGIPSGARVIHAYLYWNYIDKQYEATEPHLVFNGENITGELVSQSRFIHWYRNMTRTFRADVTDHVSGNGEYLLEGLTKNTNVYGQGASLIVIYEDLTEPKRTIIIQEGSHSLTTDVYELSTSMTGFVAADTGSGLDAKTTYIASDGERYPDFATFSGGQGTFVVQDPFDGSEGVYWDNDTYDVSEYVKEGATDAYFTVGRGHEAMTWVAQVFSVTVGDNNLPLHERAAQYAVELAGQGRPEGYLFGGKGWDYGLSSYVPAPHILSGYEYTQGLFGIGVDCSGLIAWAYNYANDPTAPFLKNFIKYVASYQEASDVQSEPINEEELRPGDILSFDFNPASGASVDHVAMYVGDQGDYEIVNAASENVGIQTLPLIVMSSLPNFLNYRRPIEGKIAMAIEAGSPIDLIVTDPEGLTIAPGLVVENAGEGYSGITGELYYSESVKGHDGDPADIVYAPHLKEGIYHIQVVPDPTADPSETYSLLFTAENQTFTLAKDISIQDIPEAGYGVSVVGSAIKTFVPMSVDIKPGTKENTINLGSKGNVPVALLGSNSFDALKIDPTSVIMKGATVKLRGKDVIQANMEDVNGDDFLDLLVHIDTEALQASESDTEAIVEARLLDGTLLMGTDVVRIVP